MRSVVVILGFLIIFGCTTRPDSAKTIEIPVTTEKEKPAMVRITGKVLKAVDSTAIPGAFIMVPGSATGTITNDGGQFVIQVPEADTIQLVFAGNGFESRKLIVNPKIENIICLKHKAG